MGLGDQWEQSQLPPPPQEELLPHVVFLWMEVPGPMCWMRPKGEPGPALTCSSHPSPPAVVAPSAGCAAVAG